MRELTRLEHEFLIKFGATYALDIAKRDRFAHIENELDGSDFSNVRFFHPIQAQWFRVFIFPAKEMQRLKFWRSRMTCARQRQPNHHQIQKAKF